MRATVSWRALLVLAAAAVAVLVVALWSSPASGGSAATEAGGKQVAARDNFFSPRRIRVRRGGRVRWVWKGDNTHSVTFRRVPRGASKRSSGAPRRRDRFSRRFTKRGAYRYVCTVHELLGMKGAVTVP